LKKLPTTLEKTMLQKTDTNRRKPARLIVPRPFTGGLFPAFYQRDNEQDKEDDEQNFGNCPGNAGNAPKTQGTGDDRHQ
jgi:hypothetical protein